MSAQPTGGPVLGLLHTGAIHPPVFDALVSERIAGEPALRSAEIVHVTDSWLLDTAIASGVTPLVTERVAGHVDALVARGAAAVLVTCSSIGEVTEEVAASAPIPVLRIDVAMARSAVAVARERSSRLTVLATLQSTLGPTTRLIDRELESAGGGVVVQSQVIEGAVARRDAGDQAGHDALIAAAVRDARAVGDVVVLAQASMARAVPEPDPLVLSSPTSAVQSLLEAARPTRR